MGELLAKLYRVRLTEVEAGKNLKRWELSFQRLTSGPSSGTRAVHRTVAGLGPGPGPTAEHGPRGGLRIERVRLPQQPAGRAVGPVHLIYLDLLR